MEPPGIHKGKEQSDKFSHKFAGAMINEIYMSFSELKILLNHEGSARQDRGTHVDSLAACFLYL